MWLLPLVRGLLPPPPPSGPGSIRTSCCRPWSTAVCYTLLRNTTAVIIIAFGFITFGVWHPVDDSGKAGGGGGFTVVLQCRVPWVTLPNDVDFCNAKRNWWYELRYLATLVFLHSGSGGRGTTGERGVHGAGERTRRPLAVLLNQEEHAERNIGQFLRSVECTAMLTSANTANNNSFLLS